MKTILKKLSVSLLLLALVTCVSAQKKEERKAKKLKAFNESFMLVEKGAFRFVAEKAFPQGGSSVDLTTNFGYLDISENKVECDLPFFGRAYRLDYGGDGGMNFKGEIFNEKLVKNDKKMKITYSFEVRDKESFKVIMNIFSKESCSVIIQSNNKAHISYDGEIKALEKKMDEDK